MTRSIVATTQVRKPVESVTYNPPDSVVVEQIQRAFPFDELRERARAMTQREQKFDFVALFYTLSLGFAAGSDLMLESGYELLDLDELLLWASRNPHIGNGY